MSTSNYISQTDSYSITGCVPGLCRWGNTCTGFVSPVIYAVYMWRFPRTSSTYTDTGFKHVTITSFPHILIASSIRMYLQSFPQKNGITHIQKTSTGKIA